MSQVTELPHTDQMNRSDMLDAFVAVVNICEPDHPTKIDPYPITADEVEFSWTTAYFAKCGPRYGNDVAYYAVNTDYVSRQSTERHLALLAHEVSHITEGSHTDGAIHNKAFWREMAFNATEMRDSWDRIESVFGDCCVELFEEEVIADPNGATVDKRIQTVEERKQKMQDQIGL